MIQMCFPLRELVEFPLLHHGLTYLALQTRPVTAKKCVSQGNNRYFH